MANHQSSKKRIRQTATKRAHNRLFHKTTKQEKKKNYPFRLNIFLCFDLFKTCGNGGYFLLKAHTDADKGLHVSEKDT